MFFLFKFQNSIPKMILPKYVTWIEIFESQTGKNKKIKMS